MMEIAKPITLPEGLLTALERKDSSMEYTAPNFLYQVVWLWGETFCGVFGDGPNASYEWFVWDKKGGILEISNCGYGSTTVALRDVLLKMEPLNG